MNEYRLVFVKKKKKTPSKMNCSENENLTSINSIVQLWMEQLLDMPKFDFGLNNYWTCFGGISNYQDPFSS